MSGFLSWRQPRALTLGRLLAALLLLGAVTVAVAALSVLVGVDSSAQGRSLRLLPLAAFSGDGPEHQILWLRISRTVAGLLVGAALGGAGCALQALLRNPLAEPYTLGVSSGSALLAVIGIRLGFDRWLGELGIAGAALAGAALALAAVWQLARVGRHLPPATLVLAGVTVSMFCSAASLLVQATADFTEISRMLRWMMGGLDGRRWIFVEGAALPILGGLLLLWWSARELNALAAGEEAAASVGVSVGRTHRLVFAVASLLIGVSISLGGPIGFVGLIVPHALRALLGPDHRLLLPASALGGGVLVVLCDLVARLAIAPAQLPTGAVTALFGGPFFVLILVWHKRRAGMWEAP
ncbi:MAG: iron ABC transporter permease [Myxococcales bacterium]|jgi:iron complex transport system permease protein|nr:iron ABC transporter permease [Myxococcales bacterium]